MLITSNFSFSQCVFKRLVLQTRKNQGLFGKGLINNSTVSIRETGNVGGCSPPPSGHQHFLLYPQCFQKASCFEVIKSCGCVVKGKTFFLFQIYLYSVREGWFFLDLFSVNFITPGCHAVGMNICMI